MFPYLQWLWLELEIIRNKLSQEELSERIDIAERNLSKIECGKSFIRAEKIGKLANALGVAPKDLFDFEYQKDLDKIRSELVDYINSNDENLREMYRIFQILK